MEERLRRSAGFWRGLAWVAMVLGIIGSIAIAIAVSKTEGYYGEQTDVGMLIGVLIGSLFAVVLSLGFFFMGTRIMEGLAELLDRTPARAGERGRRSSPEAQAERRYESPHAQQEAPIMLDDRLAAPLRTAVERLRQVALGRGDSFAVTAISATEAVVDSKSGKFRITLGDDGQAKVEGLSPE
jgi:hypothetical protein